MSETQQQPKPRVFEALIEVQRNIDGITKDRRNKDQGFSFRGIDDVYNMLHDVLAKAGLITIPRVLERIDGERATNKGGTMLHVKLKVEYDFLAADGSRCTVGPVWGEALDTSDKASNKALAFAHKYAMMQTFTIPTEDTRETAEDRDADTRTTETTGPVRQQQGGAQGQGQTVPVHQIVLQKFAEIGIGRSHLEKRWGKRVEDFSDDDVQKARELYREICDHPHQRSAHFDPPFATAEQKPQQALPPPQRPASNAGSRLNNRGGAGGGGQ